jgi:hypothetical protein
MDLVLLYFRQNSQRTYIVIIETLNILYDPFTDSSSPGLYKMADMHRVSELSGRSVQFRVHAATYNMFWARAQRL